VSMPKSPMDQHNQALSNAWDAADQAKVYQDLRQPAEAHAESAIARAWAAIAGVVSDAMKIDTRELEA
jgi:hypothetical protein